MWEFELLPQGEDFVFTNSELLDVQVLVIRRNGMEMQRLRLTESDRTRLRQVLEGSPE